MLEFKPAFPLLGRRIFQRIIQSTFHSSDRINQSINHGSTCQLKPLQKGCIRRVYPLNEKIGKTNVSNKTKQFKFGLVFYDGIWICFSSISPRFSSTFSLLPFTVSRNISEFCLEEVFGDDLLPSQLPNRTTKAMTIHPVPTVPFSAVDASSFDTK